MSKKLSKNNFIRMCDEGRAPPAVMSEMRRLLKSRADITRSKTSTKPCALLYQKHPVLFAELYNKYSEQCSVTLVKDLPPRNTRKVAALRRAPRIEIRAETLRHKRDYEDLARGRGMSLNALFREVFDGLVRQSIDPLREPSLTKASNSHDDKHERTRKPASRTVRPALGGRNSRQD